MVRLVKTTNVYEDDKGRFETNMELEFIMARPNKERQYHFKDAYDNSVVLDEAQHYENGENYVKWLPNQIVSNPITK